MELHVGTSGYSYKEWKGSFYPDKMPAKDMLAFYGQHFSTVEINNTFYRLPRADVLESWASQVPDSFRFSVKASRRITHLKRLKEVEEPTAYLMKTLETLGDKLGIVLFQLPPFSKKDMERLQAFLAILPPNVPAALEFRNETWFDDEVYDALRASGCSLCVADTEDDDTIDIVRTADVGYLRLRKCEYSDAELSSWGDAIRAQKWSRAFVYFKHEDEGTGPALAKRFLEAWDSSPS